MAKRTITRERSRAWKRPISLLVKLARRGHGFEVCLLGGGKAGPALFSCAQKSNPREALATAFRMAAADLAKRTKRSGAFAGLGSGRGRRRRGSTRR